MSSDRTTPPVDATHRDEPQPSLFDPPQVEAPTQRRAKHPAPAGPGVCVCDRERDPGGDWFEQLRKRCGP